MNIGTRRGGFTPVRLLVAAIPALLVAAAGMAAYPHLVGFAAPAAVLTMLRATVGFCMIAVVLLPVAALVRRLSEP